MAVGNQALHVRARNGSRDRLRRVPIIIQGAAPLLQMAFVWFIPGMQLPARRRWARC
jgi:hypothetical protein